MRPHAPDPSDVARALLVGHGVVRAQPATDWRGSVSLPAEVADFYARVGPVDVTIEGYGNPYLLPRLAGLWDFQAGYRWDGRTGEPADGWDGNWIVVADEGGDPFIFDAGSSKVLFARHGAGAWEPEAAFDDLPTMAACLATLGSTVRDAGDDFTDADALVRPEHRDRAVARLAELLGSRSPALAVVRRAGWE